MTAHQARWLWWPPIPAAMLAFVVFRILTAGATTLRLVGVAVEILWLGLSLYDWRTGGAFRRWLYRNDGAAPPG